MSSLETRQVTDLARAARRLSLMRRGRGGRTPAVAPPLWSTRAGARPCPLPRSVAGASHAHNRTPTPRQPPFLEEAATAIARAAMSVASSRKAVAPPTKVHPTTGVARLTRPIATGAMRVVLVAQPIVPVTTGAVLAASPVGSAPTGSIHRAMAFSPLASGAGAGVGRIQTEEVGSFEG